MEVLSSKSAAPSASRSEVPFVDPVPRLNRLFGERYHFRREVGRGRVGVVFQAEDLRYGRSLAVKAMWAQGAGEEAAQQHLREIEIAARLSHPYLLLPVFDS